MKIDGAGNLCMWCMGNMVESPYCPHCGHDEREPQQTEQAIPAGSLLGGHFLVGRTLGRGGFGITYLAYDLDLHVKRAIKEYFPQGLASRDGNTVRVARQSLSETYQKGVDSFYREAQSVAQFGCHPNVVQIHAFFRENNTAYFVMDYVEGISFRQYLEDRGGRISWEETLRILKPIGEALSAMHAAHLLHRDIKPDNIYITKDGIPKLLDFGAARYETSESTNSSAAVLTPGYAPVEQYGSKTRQGAYTDVYALSATFYRAVSGAVPLSAPDRLDEDTLLRLDQVDGQVPARIAAALAHGMCVRRENRTQTVAQLLQELEIKAPQKKKSIPVLPAFLGALVLLLGFVLVRGRLNLQSDRAAETEAARAAWNDQILKTQTAQAARNSQIAETEAAQAAWNSMLSETATALAEVFAQPSPTEEGPDATEEPQSAETAAPTQTNTPEPQVPVTGLTASVNENSVSLSWNAVGGGRLYEVERSISPESGFEIIGRPFAAEFTASGFEAGKTYYFRVRSLLYSGSYSLYSPIVSAAIPSVPTMNPTVDLSTPVTGLKASVSGDTVSLTWNAYENRRSYEIESSTSPDSGFEIIGQSITADYAASNLTAGTTYYFRVRALLPGQSTIGSYYGTNYSLYSPIVSAAIPSVPTMNPTVDPFAPVTGLKASVSGDTVSLTWNAYENRRCYEIESSTSPDSGFEIIGQSITADYAASNLTAGTTYYFRVRALLPGQSAINKVSYSAYSETVQATIMNVITEEIRNAQAGDHIFFGSYEQDNDPANGAEPIEWRVLERKNNQLLLLSEYGLDAMYYHETQEEITWENCTLRGWLNEEFYQSAFSAEEQKHIALSWTGAGWNMKYSADAGQRTENRVFLLDHKEAEFYIPEAAGRRCHATAYAIANGAYGDANGGPSTIRWWLRGPGYYGYDAANVYSDGTINYGGSSVADFKHSIRPAIRLNLDAAASKSEQ